MPVAHYSHNHLVHLNEAKPDQRSNEERQCLGEYLVVVLNQLDGLENLKMGKRPETVPCKWVVQYCHPTMAKTQEGFWTQ